MLVQRWPAVPTAPKRVAGRTPAWTFCRSGMRNANLRSSALMKDGGDWGRRRELVTFGLHIGTVCVNERR